MDKNETKDNYILTGDCMDILPVFPDKTFDLVFYDPPYNVGKKYDGYSDKLGNTEYVDWMINVLNQSARVSRNGVIVYVSGALTGLFMTLMPNAHLIIVHKKAAGVVSGNYMLQYHSIFADATPVVKCKDLWGDIRLPGEGYFFKEKRYDNPGMTSVALIKRILFHFSVEGELILDPFMGCGATAEACLTTNRRFVGIEQSMYYCKIAKERIKQLQLQPRLGIKSERIEYEGEGQEGY